MLHDFNATVPASINFKAALQYSGSLDPQPSNEEFMTGLREEPPVEVLIHSDWFMVLQLCVPI